jgi:hypothetical protein
MSLPYGSAEGRKASPIFRGIIVAILLVLALQPIYLLALAGLDYVAPVDRRAAHLAAAFEINERVGTPDGVGNWDTECVALSIGLEPGASPLRNAVTSSRPLPAAQQWACSVLAAAVAHQAGIEWLPYPRYWHGYRLAIDFLIAWLPIKNTRYVMLVLLIATLAFFAAESRKLLGKEAALALAVPIVVITEMWHMWVVILHAISTIAVLAGAAWFARRLRSGTRVGALIATAAVLGSTYNYVDLLINPPWQPMLLAFFMVAAPRRVDGPHSLFDAGMIVIAWFGGYALTWASKWIIAAALSPNGIGVLQDIADVVRYRLDGDYLQVVDHHLLAPTKKVLALTFLQVWQTPWAAALVMLTPALLPSHRIMPRRFLLLASPSLIPFLWFELLSNHTQIHATFVYRPVASSVGILIAAWILAAPEKALAVQTAGPDRSARA